VEKSSPSMRDSSVILIKSNFNNFNNVILIKNAQIKQSPEGRKSGHSGANPTIAIYNASVIIFCNAKGSLLRL
jgi:hypothetical protein